MNSKNIPITFDRAAEYYDSTRALPAGVAEKIVSALLTYTQENRCSSPTRMLEIGIGTGRIAVPCLAQGYTITGIDLSWKMMKKFRQNLTLKGNHFKGELLGLAQANATWLPFNQNSFDTVLAVHVLHLIKEWQKVIQEARRVTSPGGSLILGYDGRSPTSPIALLREKFDEILFSNGVSNKRILKRDYSDVDEYMEGEGCTISECSAAEWRSSTTVAGDLEKLNQRIWSSTWDIPDDIYTASLAQLKNWANETYGDLQAERSVPHRFVWKIYQWT